MELVKLKMRSKYKILLSIIFILLLLLIIIGLKYKPKWLFGNNKSEIDVNGNLSINYLDGKNIKVESNSTYKFSVTNEGKLRTYYKMLFSGVNGNGTFKLISDEEIISEGEIKDEFFTNNIIINPNETKKYNLEIKNNGEEKLLATVNINVEENNVKFNDLILSHNKVKNESDTNIGTDISTKNEGLIKGSDDLGTTYYFRGDVKNNYVSFGNNIWRIIRINGDNTIRIILDGETESISNYYKDTTDFNFINSKIHAFLSNWLSENFGDYEKYIADTKYCSDIVHDDSFNYNALTRIKINKIPSFNCLGTSYNDNIGLITADEVVYAGANLAKNNQEYYLYNKDLKSPWYTMTGASGTENSINMFMVNEKGVLITNVSGDLFRSVRPVINIISDVDVTGDGTKDNPYTIIK